MAGGGLLRSTRMYMCESVKRREDWRFLTGRGRYIDYIAMPGAVHAAFVRSSHAHSMISIDTAAAKAMPGVLLVLTGEDWAAARLGVLPCVWQIRSSDGSTMREALCEVLARDRVLHVGDTIDRTSVVKGTSV